MLYVEKTFLVFVSFVWSFEMSEGEPIKGDLVGHQPGVEFLQLGAFGPVSGLSSHPAFSPLGLTSQQIIGFVDILLRNGLLNPYALKLNTGQPFMRDFGLRVGPGPFFGIPMTFMVDPYILFLQTNYERFLPFGLGPQGIYGSTGVPKPRPLGVFKYNDKN